MRIKPRDKVIPLLYAIACLMIANINIIAQQKVTVALVKDLKLPEMAELTVFDFKDPQSPKAKVEVFKKSIVFYDEDSEVRATVEYDEPIGVDHSENEQFFSVATVNQYPTANEVGQYQVDFYEANGNKLCSIMSEFYEELPPPKFSISNTGTIIELNSMNGNLVLYNKNGQSLKKINFYQFSDMGTALSCRFANSGNLLVVGVNYPLAEAQQKNSEIVLYDNFGNEEWRFKSNQGYVSNQLFISSDEQYVVSSHYDQPKYEKGKNKRSSGPKNLTTYILDVKNGAIIFEHPNIRAREVLFFQHDGRDYALINDVGDRIIYINLAVGTEGKTYSLLSNEEILGMDVDIYTQMVVMVKSTIEYIKLPQRGYRRTLTQPQLEFFDLDGNLLSRQSLPIPQLSEYLFSNQLKFLDNGDKLLIYLKSGKELMVFAINK